MAFSSNDTIGSDMVWPPSMIDFDTQIIPRHGAMSLLYLDYAAVKVRKRLYVTPLETIRSIHLSPQEAVKESQSARRNDCI